MAGARERDPETARRALAELCELYWYPLYAFVRRSGRSPEDAEDLTQAFLAHLLEREDFGRADPARGRLRSYLLGALKHFLANEAARAGAARRGGGARLVPLDRAWGESQLALEPADPGMTPDQLYDRRWALSLLASALEDVRKGYEARGKGEQFETLAPFLAWNSGEDFAAAAETLGLTESGVRVAVHRLRRRYRDAVSAAVADTVTDSADLASELAGLRTLFSGDE